MLGPYGMVGIQASGNDATHGVPIAIGHTPIGHNAAPPTGCVHPKAALVDGVVTCLECGEDLGEAEKQSNVISCAICGGTDRWDDNGVHRCRVCYPPDRPMVKPKSRRRSS
jgi:hypothetical protein